MSNSSRKTPVYLHKKDDLSSHTHRQFIGLVGFLMPLVLWLMAGWRPLGLENVDRWAPMGSISAYYYSGGVAAFIGSLIAMAFFLFTYKGYQNEYGRRDRIAAKIAGIAAVLIAIFPTAAPYGVEVPVWWMEYHNVIHHLAAATLFGCFVFFSLFQFPLSKSEKKLSLGKRIRNALFTLCGITIVLCVVWAIAVGINGQSIFLPEAVALEFFALSWLIKGRADKTAAAVAAKTRKYFRNSDPPFETARRSFGD